MRETITAAFSFPAKFRNNPKMQKQKHPDD